MSEQLREQLSALMDGELPRDQLRFLLRRIDSDAQLAQVWSRYQLAGGVLRRQLAAQPLRKDFAETLMQRLDAGATGLGVRVLRWAGGGAIAAAVAVVALVSTRPGGTLPEPATTVAALPPAISAPALTGVPPPMRPAVDFTQPASFETGVVPLPRYRYELGGVDADAMLGPYVLITRPPPQPQREDANSH